MRPDLLDPQVQQYYGNSIFPSDVGASELDILDIGVIQGGDNGDGEGENGDGQGQEAGGDTQPEGAGLYEDYPIPFSQSAVTFFCAICEVDRAKQRRIRVDRDVCIYCHTGAEENDRLRYCMACGQERPEDTFVSEEGYPRTACSVCQGR